jgi:hypothetical protein
MPQPIPIIDLFAAPADLARDSLAGETATDDGIQNPSSIEMTLGTSHALLRSFFRQFDPANLPSYQYLGAKFFGTN